MTSMKAYEDVDEHAFMHHLEEFNTKNKIYMLYSCKR